MKCGVFFSVNILTVKNLRDHETEVVVWWGVDLGGAEVGMRDWYGQNVFYTCMNSSKIEY